LPDPNRRAFFEGDRMNQFRCATGVAAGVLAALNMALAAPALAAPPGAAAAGCSAPAAWFSGRAVPRPDPGNGAQFDSNCAFHQFSWQAFLWLTQVAAPGKLRFETLYSDRAIVPGAPAPRTHVLGGVNQANSHGILVDQNGRAVYTAMMIDDVYRSFVIKNQLYTAAGMQQADAAMTFPNGALSLKSTWKILAPGEDASRFYTTNATIELLSKVDGGVGIAANPATARARVALVGLHVAMVVAGHPEAIWATFEHVDNAPDFGVGQLPSAVVAERSYTFYKGGTIAADCNAGNAGVVELDPRTQQLSPPTQACRQYRAGGGDPANVNNIDSLNQSVLSQLAARSPWKNYREVGAVWFKGKDKLVPDWTPNVDPSPLAGSTLLSSAVIETFTQNTSSANGCFSCHNTMAVTDTNDITRVLSGKNINTSHILLQKYLNVASVKR
jgi:hypothetical protein